MLKEIRGGVNNDELIHLFLDRASFHMNQDMVLPEMKNLSIIPHFNVSYRFEF